jgi:hypothetical protein
VGEGIYYNKQQEEGEEQLKVQATSSKMKGQATTNNSNSSNAGRKPKLNNKYIRKSN